MANQYKLSTTYPMQVERKRTAGPGPATSYLACPRCKSTKVKVNQAQNSVTCLGCKHNGPKTNFTVYPKR